MLVPVQLLEAFPLGTTVKASTQVKPEVAVGMVAASLTCLDLNHQLRAEMELRPYLVAGYIHSDDIKEITTAKSKSLEKNDYHWWVRTVPTGEYYSLYRFKTPYFIQGVIDMCTKCEVDFRVITQGLPWKVDGTVYKLNGYDLVNYQYQVVVEDSISDERDEWDNSNIISPYGEW